MRYTVMAAGLGTLLLSGCTFGVGCDTGVEPGVTVLVTDRTSGLGLTGATGYLERASTRYDFMGSAESSELVGWVGEGIYSAVVERGGYQVWQRSDVRVRETGGSCPSLETVELEAELDPVPAPDQAAT